MATGGHGPPYVQVCPPGGRRHGKMAPLWALVGRRHQFFSETV